MIERTASRSPRVSLRLGDATELDDVDAYDAVLACDALHHFPPDTHKPLAVAVARALKPGGVCVVKDLDIAPTWKYQWNRLHDRIVAGPDPIHCRAPDDMADILGSAGLQVEQVERIDGRWEPYAHYVVRARRPRASGPDGSWPQILAPAPVPRQGPSSRSRCASATTRSPTSALACARTRWPDAETVDDWAQGVPLAYVRELCAYWADGYDFGLADRVNAFPQVRATVDGLGIHALHVRSPEPDALPLVLTHGWPGSVVEFLDVLGPLTDPAGPRRRPRRRLPRRGAVAARATGGATRRPSRAGASTASLAPGTRLMGALGYDRYGAQGGDWGAGRDRQPGPAGARPAWSASTSTCRPWVPTESTLDDLTPRRSSARSTTSPSTGPPARATRPSSPPARRRSATASPTRPPASAPGSSRSSGPGPTTTATPSRPSPATQMLDDVSVYWFTEHGDVVGPPVLGELPRPQRATRSPCPSGISIFPREIFRPSRRWAERRYTDLRWYETLDRGGHFAAFEQPEVFVDQVRGLLPPRALNGERRPCGPGAACCADALLRLDLDQPALGRGARHRPPRRGHRVGRHLDRRPLHGQRRRPIPADVPDPRGRLAGRRAGAPPSDRVRIGTLVYGNTYRHPAVLANMAATADHVSGGRFVLGIGAGWQVNEHEQYGIDLPPVGERVDRFEEAIQVVRSLLPRAHHHVRRRPLPADRRPVRAQAGPGPSCRSSSGPGATGCSASRPATPTSGTPGACPTTSPSGRRRSTPGARPRAATPTRSPARRRRCVFFTDDDAEAERLMPTRCPARCWPARSGGCATWWPPTPRPALDELIVPDFTLGSGSPKLEALDRFIDEVAAGVPLTAAATG